MKTFKEFLAEAPTRKVFISHLDKMKPLEFLALVGKFEDEYGGVLSREKLSITEKIDGSALRVGQDKNGRPFIESSTSASMFKVGDFVARDLSKGYSGTVGRKFDKLLGEFQKDKKFQSVLSKYNSGNGIKVIGEILYPPMALEDLEDTIKFIRIRYDKKKLGSDWTFVPFSVIDDDGNQYQNSEEIRKAIFAISTDKRKYVPPTLNIDTDIDISVEIKDIQQKVLAKYKNIDELLTSRKHADRELKEKIKDELAVYQKALAAKIISYVKGGLFGKDFEGLVIKLPDGDILKVVSDVFKAGKFQP